MKRRPPNLRWLVAVVWLVTLVSCATKVTPTGPPLVLKSAFTAHLAADPKRAIVFPAGTYVAAYEFLSSPHGPGVYYVAPSPVVEVGSLATPGGVFIPNANHKDQRECVYRWNDLLFRRALVERIPFAVDETAKP